MTEAVNAELAASYPFVLDAQKLVPTLAGKYLVLQHEAPVDSIPETFCTAAIANDDVRTEYRIQNTESLLSMI